MVNDEDVIHYCTMSWYADKDGYPTSRIKGKHVKLHKLIAKRMGLDESLEVDHKDGDVLNCQRFNLRSATHQQNAWNRACRSTNRTGYTGVAWKPHAKKYSARIRVNGKLQHLGYFDSVEDAGAAYRAAALKSFGEFARLA